MAVVPGCCRARVCEEMFKPRTARKRLKQYRRKGLDPLERRMVKSIAATQLDGARVLEIGGGIGTIQAELLAAGAHRGEIAEVVPAYEPYARTLAQDLGIEGRSRFRVTDVLERPESVEPADIVVLNRVVCCSREGVTLTGVAARLTNRMLLLCYPRDRFVVRVVIRATNGVLRIMGRSFRVFLHSRDALHAAARAEGLVIAEIGRSIAWEFASLRRNA
jgi:hypothetical protein